MGDHGRRPDLYLPPSSRPLSIRRDSPGAGRACGMDPRARPRNREPEHHLLRGAGGPLSRGPTNERREEEDRKSTRLNSSHGSISYAVFCLKKKKKKKRKKM